MKSRWRRRFSAATLPPWPGGCAHRGMEDKRIVALDLNICLAVKLCATETAVIDQNRRWREDYQSVVRGTFAGYENQSRLETGDDVTVAFAHMAQAGAAALPLRQNAGADTAASGLGSWAKQSARCPFRLSAMAMCKIWNRQLCAWRRQAAMP
ncbi:MAG: hypothetical protein ACLT0Y_07190 [Christensenellales bacterium]